MQYLALAIVALFAYSLVDVLATDHHLIRHVPKPVWVVAVFMPLAGPIAWLVLGRPRGGSLLPGTTGRLDHPMRPRDTRRTELAPDDDPEFLRRLRDPRDDR